MFLIHKVLSLFEKADAHKKVILGNINSIFPEVPNMIVPLKTNFLHFEGAHQICRVGDSTQFSIKNNDLENPSLKIDHSIIIPPWSDNVSSTQQKLKESMMIFFAKISKDFLIKSQMDTPWIATIRHKVQEGKSHFEY